MGLANFPGDVEYSNIMWQFVLIMIIFVDAAPDANESVAIVIKLNSTFAPFSAEIVSFNGDG